MRLDKLLSRIPHLTVRRAAGSEDDPDILSIQYDSRKVVPGSLFCAVVGFVTDGHLYLEEAVRRGAAAVASEKSAPEGFQKPWIQVTDIRKFMAETAAEFYQHPSSRLRLVGITGTNGKTTTAFLTHSIQQTVGPSLLLGTVGIKFGERYQDSARTTPEALDIQATLAEAESSGCRWGALEVSSHALVFWRAYSCRFPVAVFTNLSQDHLDFHQTMEEYCRAKELLFERTYNPGLERAILNGDDRFASRVDLPQDVGRICFGMSGRNDIYPESTQLSADGIDMRLSFRGRTLRLKSVLVGEHNCYNIMAAAAACTALGIPDELIVKGVSDLSCIPGRFERVPIDRSFSVFIDYAHTPHALENALRLARSVAKGRLISVFGCGGDRDRAKRPVMGRIGVEYSDIVFLTSDNPRSEVPEEILSEIEAGIPPQHKNFRTISNRAEAIGEAIRSAREGDLILLAGKGHETYQEIQGVKRPFDEREIVRRAVD